MQPAARSTSPGGDGERHHAVIVFADVVGYSRLMADDEPGTLNRWTALYKNVLKPEAERRRGELASRTSALEPSNALARSAKGNPLSYLRREDAVPRR